MLRCYIKATAFAAMAAMMISANDKLEFRTAVCAAAAGALESAAAAAASAAGGGGGGFGAAGGGSWGALARTLEVIGAST
jgi:hypothetical protein